ncbi:MAG TPA: hypothetical protein VG502_01940 [Flexivirga sp.]|uniref:hypothetical protein n=1 Tax=Flexivirga sp. TaxID=1962927 RepID=UPI002BE18FF6|nr:hypothetical protein [Flexivirga sp.]HWC21037.1 hypothetical protein [Flexivirga sp.]
MRTMMRVHMDTRAGNEAARSGALAKGMDALMNEIHPEASYFFLDGGRRSAMFVFDLADPSRLPIIAEPLFGVMNAEIEFTPVMSLEDLQKGLSQLTTAP